MIKSFQALIVQLIASAWCKGEGEGDIWAVVSGASLSEEMTYELQELSGRENSKCQGPEVGTSLACLRDKKMA